MIRCRHCDEPLSTVVADLGLSPVANALPRQDQAGPDALYPLRVLVCSSCRLVQTEDLCAADELFGEDYTYFSSFSTSWLRHAERYVGDMVGRFGLGPDATHVEVASNDGYLLQYSKAAGLRTLGVEPSLSVAKVAREKGIETRTEFFGQAIAEGLVTEGWAADLVTANNVFAHVPDVNDFAAGLAALLKPEGVATIEVQHLLRMMQKREFDTIYHEHFSYYSLLAAKRIFESQGLRVFDVEQLSSHGGSLRYFVCRTGASHATEPRVQALLDEELAYGLDSDAVYEAWSREPARIRAAFRSMLEDFKQQGLKVSAYGAPAKGVTLLNYCGVGADLIDFTVDRAPSKQGRFIPGVRIPIQAPEAIDRLKPDVIVILPWNLKTEIMEQLAETRQWGARFVTAIPSAEVLT